MTAEKGVADAIAACRAAGVPLVVAGAGPDADAIRASAPDVRFTGRVDAAELAELRARAGLALVPSRYAEILPLAALEAMAAGLPCRPRAPAAGRAGADPDTIRPATWTR